MNNQAYLKKDTPWLQDEEQAQVVGRVIKTKGKTRLRFKPRNFWPFLVWGFTLFLGFRILFIPLVEGVYHLVVKNQELNTLKNKHQRMSEQLAKMKEARDQMKTIAWVEEQSHKAGFIKINESPMLVVNISGEDFPKTPPKSDVEIGE
jgi:hypothetical protein